MTVRSAPVIYVTAACYVTRNGDLRTGTIEGPGSTAEPKRSRSQDRLKVVLLEADSDAIEIHSGWSPFSPCVDIRFLLAYRDAIWFANTAYYYPRVPFLRIFPARAPAGEDAPRDAKPVRKSYTEDAETRVLSANDTLPSSGYYSREQERRHRAGPSHRLAIFYPPGLGRVSLIKAWTPFRLHGWLRLGGRNYCCLPCLISSKRAADWIKTEPEGMMTGGGGDD